MLDSKLQEFMSFSIGNFSFIASPVGSFISGPQSNFESGVTNLKNVGRGSGVWGGRGLPQRSGGGLGGAGASQLKQQDLGGQSHPPQVFCK